jgi:hypothetical protein
LAPLGITVRELTGDMQLTKSEILQTQVRLKADFKVTSWRQFNWKDPSYFMHFLSLKIPPFNFSASAA